jgi:hypothetical protein
MIQNYPLKKTSKDSDGLIRVKKIIPATRPGDDLS